MRSVVLASEERPGIVYELRVLRTWSERLRGLLGTGPDVAPVLLERCGSIHTFGMRYPLDVALVGEKGEALVVRRGLGPGSVLSHPAARCVLERPSSPGEWVEKGEHLRLIATYQRGERRCEVRDEGLPALRGGALCRHERVLRVPV